MFGMTMAAVFFGVWMVFSIAVLGRRSEARIRVSDELRLIPQWRFFAPTPSTSDYFVLYRDIFANGCFTEWTELRAVPRSWRDGLLFLAKRERKAELDVAMHLAQLDRSLPLIDKVVTIPYLTILNRVVQMERWVEPESTQFAIATINLGIGSSHDADFLCLRTASPPMTLTAAETMGLCARLVCVSHVLSCVELLVRGQVLRADGMMSWEVARLRSKRYIHPRWESMWNWLFRYPEVRRLILARLAVAAVILMGPQRWILAPVLLPALAAIDLLYSIRADAGSDGSDQMTTIVTLSLAVATILPTARPIALGFLGLQICLAYGVAGWAKVFRIEWWNGTYAIGISRTKTFGIPAFGEFLARHRILAAVLSSGMLVWEAGFPLVLVLPGRAAIGFLAIGLGFHLFNAFHMGLNTFVWAFASTYPALLYLLGLRGY